MNGIPALAQAVQSQGRGNDTQLVHMTPREVEGLQAIAMAHGGSLTLNPKTGLPEAGFLDQILPVVAGAALNVMVPGLGAAMGGFAIPALVGGTTALATGDIEKGFMAGLGAYGGAGLSQGFSAAGAATNALPAAPAAAGQVATTATPVAASSVPSALGDQAFLNQMGGFSQAPTATAATGTSVGASTLPADMTAALKGGASYGTSSAPTMGYNLSQAGEGFKGVFSGGEVGEAARQGFMSEAGVGGLGGLAKYGGAAVMPLLASDAEGAPAGTPQMIRPYTYSAGRQDVPYRTGAMGESTAEQEYFRPSYTALPMYRAKTGGSVPELEEGGFVMTKKAVDGVGGGNNKKGQEELRKGLGAIPIKGKGTGTSDSIKTTIAGKVPARVSNGEAYVPKDKVKKAGGTTNMYALMRNAEKKANRKA